MKTWTVEFELTGDTRAPGPRTDTYEGTLAEAKAAFAEDVHRYGGRIKSQNWVKSNPPLSKIYTTPPILKTPKPCECGSPHARWQEHREDEIPYYQCDACASRRTGTPIEELHPMKPNHTADEVVTIEGPVTHSLDIERVRSVIDDMMHRVGTVYVTFHFTYLGKHRTHSDDFKPSDKWFPVIEELFDEVTAVYKVTIQPSDRLGKAKGNPGIPITHLRMSRAPKGQHALHVGLAPFRDANGSLVASYQVINDQGVSEGLFSVVDGKVFDQHFLPTIADSEKYIAAALNHFKKHVPLDNPRNPRRPTRMGVVLGNAIRGNPVLQTGVRESSDDLDAVTGEAQSLSQM